MLLVMLVACGGNAKTAAELCDQLPRHEGCDGDYADTCSAALESALADSPGCEPMFDALAACMAGLELSCVPVDQLSARGDGEFDGPDNFTSFGDDPVFDWIVNDTACDLHKRGLDACLTCPAAPGAREIGVKGIGEPCAGASECADGLDCADGQCTRDCETEDDCDARSKDCRMKVQFGNTCAEIDGVNRCTRSCSNGSTICEIDFGPGYTCVDEACVPG